MEYNRLRVPTSMNKTYGTLTASWEPPPDAWLNFTNCTAATRWYAAALATLDEDTASDDVQMGKAYDYLKSLIPSNFTTRPTYSEVLGMVCRWPRQ